MIDAKPGKTRRGKTRSHLHNQAGKLQTLPSLPCGPTCPTVLESFCHEAVCRAVNTHGTGEDLGHHAISQQGRLPDQSPTATSLQPERASSLRIANHSSSQTMTLERKKKHFTPSFSYHSYLVTFSSQVVPALSLP